jgi:4-hydroxy-tetrahydrodipicolinate synthase
MTALAPGVWGVLATPFIGADLAVDHDSLRGLAKHFAQTGATGLTVLGVFGEAAQLSAAERTAVLETVVDSVGLPLVTGVTALGTAPAVEEIRAAQRVTGDRLAAAMVQISTARPETLTRHLEAVYAATGAALVVQDYPAATGVRIPADVLASVLRDLPFVVAVKAESSPTAVTVAALSDLPGISVFGGLGGLNLLDELAAGAAGAMTGFSFPEGLVACVTAYREHGAEAARAAWAPYLPLVAFEQQAPVALAIRKECLRRLGLLREATVRPPAAPLPDALRRLLPRLDRSPR